MVEINLTRNIIPDRDSSQRTSCGCYSNVDITAIWMSQQCKCHSNIIERDITGIPVFKCGSRYSFSYSLQLTFSRSQLAPPALSASSIERIQLAFPRLTAHTSSSQCQLQLACSASIPNFPWAMASVRTSARGFQVPARLSRLQASAPTPARPSTL